MLADEHVWQRQVGSFNTIERLPSLNGTETALRATYLTSSFGQLAIEVQTKPRNDKSSNNNKEENLQQTIGPPLPFL